MINHLATNFGCTVALLLLSATQAKAQKAFPVVPPLTYESGDTWLAQGTRYRLYGVQACIRGTPYVMPNGAEGDCGDASLRMLAGLMATLKVSCTPIERAPTGAVVVVCAGQSRDKPVDLGAAMIVSGYAFSAELPSGAPVNVGYFASEIRAQTDKAGLWGARSFTHPVKALNALGKQLQQPAKPPAQTPAR